MLRPIRIMSDCPITLMGQHPSFPDDLGCQQYYVVLERKEDLLPYKVVAGRIFGVPVPNIMSRNMPKTSRALSESA